MGLLFILSEWKIKIDVKSLPRSSDPVLLRFAFVTLFLDQARILFNWNPFSCRTETFFVSALNFVTTELGWKATISWGWKFSARTIKKYFCLDKWVPPHLVFDENWIWSVSVRGTRLARCHLSERYSSWKPFGVMLRCYVIQTVNSSPELFDNIFQDIGSWA